MPRRFRIAMLGMAFLIVLLSGCATTSQPAHQVQQVQQETNLPASAEVKTESPPINASSQLENETEPEIDEKMSVFFALGSSAVSNGEKAKLREAASRLKDDSDSAVTLVGRANDHGSRSVNLAVADARVEAVASLLKRLGVKTWQIKKNVIGGEKAPAHCRVAECRRLMRRVELVFSVGHQGNSE